jgi:hypothetical protein
MIFNELTFFGLYYTDYKLFNIEIFESPFSRRGRRFVKRIGFPRYCGMKEEGKLAMMTVHMPELE